MVRKLRGPVKKETKHEKRQRRQENAVGKQRFITFVIPSLIAVVVVVGLIIYLGTKK